MKKIQKSDSIILKKPELAVQPPTQVLVVNVLNKKSYKIPDTFNLNNSIQMT
jgi:hypothetical protein